MTEAVWFMLTLVLDIIPYAVLSEILLKKYLKKSFPVTVAKTVTVFLLYDSGICVTYMNGMYGQKIMVLLRILVCIPAWYVLYRSTGKFKIPFVYKCLYVIPHMLFVLELAAFTGSFFNTAGLPTFMPITCLRAFYNLLFAYPYYLLEKNILFRNFELEDNRVWGIFTVVQLILNTAMMITLRTDYAENGIDLKSFLLQLFMLMGSISVTLLMFYAFRFVRDVELIREKEKRDELLIEINSRQYSAMQKNIEQIRQVRHDMRHHIHVVEQLLAEEKYDEASRYISEYNKSIPEGVKISFCDNFSLNALLSYYYAAASERNINISIDCAALGKCGVSDTDLNIIIGNAIENAMEACECIENGERFIKLCAKRKAGQVFITVDNSFDGVIKNISEGMLSRKREYSSTWYGNASMNAVAEKYNGTVQRKIESDRYMLSVVMYEADK